MDDIIKMVEEKQSVSTLDKMAWYKVLQNWDIKSALNQIVATLETKPFINPSDLYEMADHNIEELYLRCTQIYLQSKRTGQTPQYPNQICQKAMLGIKHEMRINNQAARKKFASLIKTYRTQQSQAELTQ